MYTSGGSPICFVGPPAVLQTLLLLQQLQLQEAYSERLVDLCTSHGIFLMFILGTNTCSCWPRH